MNPFCAMRISPLLGKCNAPQIVRDRQTRCFGFTPKIGRFSLRHHKAEDNFPSLAWGFLRSTCTLCHLFFHYGINYTILINVRQRLFSLIQAHTATQLNRRYLPSRMQGKGFLLRILVRSRVCSKTQDFGTFRREASSTGVKRSAGSSRTS